MCYCIYSLIIKFDLSVPSLDEDKKLWFMIAAAVGGIFLILIITAIVSFALSKKRYYS